MSGEHIHANIETRIRYAVRGLVNAKSRLRAAQRRVEVLEGTVARYQAEVDELRARWHCCECEAVRERHRG